MGVGERSEALPNIKAMGEKMLCPPREPGLRPPRTPPPSSLSPLLNPTSIKTPALGFPVKLEQPRVEQQRGPRPLELGVRPRGRPFMPLTPSSAPHPIPLRHPDPILGSQIQGKKSFGERGENGAHWREGQRPKSSQTQM